jgi:hypothetical protein
VSRRIPDHPKLAGFGGVPCGTAPADVVLAGDVTNLPGFQLPNFGTFGDFGNPRPTPSPSHVIPAHPRLA